MVAYPEYYGNYIGDGISCLFLLPQIFLKFQERQDRRKQLTLFEIGNWICILLWVLYVDFYPNNVFLSSPKPILVMAHSAIILIQVKFSLEFFSNKILLVFGIALSSICSQEKEHFQIYICC